jgi:hypothetical protein
MGSKGKEAFGGIFCFGLQIEGSPRKKRAFRGNLFFGVSSPNRSSQGREFLVGAFLVSSPIRRSSQGRAYLGFSFCLPYYLGQLQTLISKSVEIFTQNFVKENIESSRILFFQNENFQKLNSLFNTNVLKLARYLGYLVVVPFMFSCFGIK